MTATAPLLYEIPARLLVGKFHRADSSPVTLADIPEEWFEQMASLGVNLVWLMGVWQLGRMGRDNSLQWGRDSGEFDRFLPGWTAEDVIGSPYCVQEYRVHTDFGGNNALGVFRGKLRARGIGLILDFVPNHTARDHLWVGEHPEYYVQTDTAGITLTPEQFARAGDHDFAYGRDPYFPSWTDVFQLDYRKESLQQAMMDTLAQIAPLCDGVRCDMSMLVLPEVFERTWGKLPAPFAHEEARGSFWPRAIDRVKSLWPEFLFIAEAYWGLEYRLQTLGFDHTYDKSLYDGLVHHDLPAVRSKLREWTPLVRGVHFMENHDEPRAAGAICPDDYRRACAVLNYSLPGIRFLHEGQMDGRHLRYCIHLRRTADEPPLCGGADFLRAADGGLERLAHRARRGTVHPRTDDRAGESGV
ncbi:alpha-amylase family glycosyl hydrolase [Oscillatoria laete-virens NRMC-F 0139]|nr:alpha-amylase family glycosyl hydrolase [Oscillatoria laete-virens]MDL5055769.1 alpha-amylase family glycosyl hydrolase [Oscillatoria laete-virens NRMC-F 0139]